MFKNFFKFFNVFIILLTISCPLHAKDFKNFVPEQPTLSVKQIKTGENGYILTVTKGIEPIKIPVKIVSVIPQKPGKNISDLILIKLLKGEVARGMSGSPVYIKGKIIGAVGSGWEFSDHSLALVTPIDSMCSIFDYENNYENFSSSEPYLEEVSVSGIKQNSAIQKLGKTLGVDFVQGFSSGSENGIKIQNEKFKPGDSISALLVWGDVEMSATGAVTATSKDGKFLAFGHPFLKRGNVDFPAAKAFIHDTVKSTTFPFKLSSTIAINGTIIQDREAGIGGQSGFFAQSIPAELVFKNIDSNEKSNFKFRVIADEFLSQKLLEGVYTGLLDDAWGRRGQGTMSVTLRIESKGISNGWTRKDIFFSDENITANAMKQASQIIDAFLTQPFENTMPLGFRIDVEATEKPKALIIEDVETVSKAEPGEEFEVKVTLRPWRGKKFVRNFKMKIPDDASGVSELLVRGGGVQSMPQIAIEEGWKSIDSLEKMMREIKALDANNELILELSSDNLDNAIKKAVKNKKIGKSDPDDDLLPEQKEYLSETKERRIKEGTLRIFSSDYFIDGMMKRIIRVEK